MESPQGERAFFTPVCARKQTNGPPDIDQGFSTGSCNHHHALSLCQPERCTHSPPPVSPFLLVQNLSSKRIVPTHNMQPKSDDAKGLSPACMRDTIIVYCKKMVQTKVKPGMLHAHIISVMFVFQNFFDATYFSRFLK